MMLSFRVLNLMGFLACALLIVAALIMQYQFELEPCPLCIFQRVAFMVAGLFFLLSALTGEHNRIGRYLLPLITLLSLLAGCALATRHIWLQNLPPSEVPSCGPGLDYMLDVLPFHSVISHVLSGSGECAEISWTFLGLSIPWWTLFAYLILVAVVMLAYRATGNKNSNV